MDYKKLKGEILAYRVKYNLTQEAFAELCGVSSQTIYNIVNGLQEPKEFTQLKIRAVLDNEN